MTRARFSLDHLARHATKTLATTTPHDQHVYELLELDIDVTPQRTSAPGPIQPTAH